MLFERKADITKPLVLCHGLFGFDTINLFPKALSLSSVAPISYWRGIKEVLEANDIEVIITRVPQSATIQERAQVLAEEMRIKGGLDARYLISKIRCKGVKSLTTVVTPHRGSSFADYCCEFIGTERQPRIYHFLKSLGLETGAFEQLTAKYMIDQFNPDVGNLPDVGYFSYGAAMNPAFWIDREE
ncbi:Lipase 2 [Neolecta irregularis DAH-3]|uniref:Lipase 2 n=1 Tax=Neolecta irregularis (strain DAH-3) TaxID=1198029 RepID=A0A1U7LRD0_NEOID|nr:Lipase 2 [Neolecta irregularis DAH-3]|eukprot:OLL25230.1 Lipase 2 [Neolecta irregularis DAH-3]